MVNDMMDVEPMGAEPPPPTGEDGASEGGAPPGYTGPTERCNTCEYFDSATSDCKKYSTPVEEDGHCDSWEMGGTQEQVGDTDSDTEMADLGPLE